MSKDSLIKGTLILTLAALVARVLGAIQRIPLVHLLGDAGMASYTIAFNVYSILLVIATAGVPSALSKLISERTALERHVEAARIYRASIQFSLVAGVIMAVLLYVVAPYYAVYVAHDPLSVPAIRALAPALLLFPLIAIMRGYFLGRRHTMPNGLSQIIEQIFRLTVAIFLAYFLLQLGYNKEWAIAGASFGGVAGSVGALGVMLFFAWKLRRSDRMGRSEGTLEYASVGQSKETPLSYRRIYSMIFRISVPIVIFSMTVPLIYFIDSSIVIPLLQEQIGKELAVETLGVLGGRAQSLAGIPIVLAVALSQSVIPVISSAFARKDTEELGLQASKALWLSIITGLPFVLAISVAARSINIFMFTNDIGTSIIIVLTLSAMFQIVMQTSGAVMMGLSEMKRLTVYMASGIFVKLAGSFLLAPLFGIYGIISATALCFVVMALLIIRRLRKQVQLVILGKRWLGVLAGASLAIALGAGAEILLHQYVFVIGERISALLHAMVAGGLTILVYGIMLVVTRAVTENDVKSFPAPLRKLIGRIPGRAVR